MTNTKMIYKDDNSIGIDEQSLNKFDLLFNHNNDDEPEHGDFIIKGNTLYLWLAKQPLTTHSQILLYVTMICYT